MTPLEPPDALLKRLPITEKQAELVYTSREAIKRIIAGQDPRMLMLVGPCSIHDEKACLEYAERLAKVARRIQDRILVLMRVYFEKPRTTVGWKGFINDPHLNGSFDVPTGLTRARKFLLDVLEMGLPAGIEWLDEITPQYFADCTSWGAIGARTVESQVHRQLASGLSMPIGFKNGTGGTGHSIQIAVNAVITAREPHVFKSIDGYSRGTIARSTGNDTHIVLRGGEQGTNYDADHVVDAVARLKKAGLPPYLMVDCSHGNSNKDYRNQSVVFRNVLDQRVSGNRHLVALMIESHLNEGNQKHDNGDPSKLKYGVSITDACVGWEETEQLLLEAHERLG